MHHNETTLPTDIFGIPSAELKLDDLSDEISNNEKSFLNSNIVTGCPQ